MVPSLSMNLFFVLEDKKVFTHRRISMSTWIIICILVYLAYQFSRFTDRVGDQLTAIVSELNDIKWRIEQIDRSITPSIQAGLNYSGGFSALQKFEDQLKNKSSTQK